MRSIVNGCQLCLLWDSKIGILIVLGGKRFNQGYIGDVSEYFERGGAVHQESVRRSRIECAAPGKGGLEIGTLGQESETVI
jgi:hypothetical protein